MSRALAAVAVMALVGVGGYAWLRGGDEEDDVGKPASSRVQTVLDRGRRDAKFAREKMPRALATLGPTAAGEIASRLQTDAAYHQGPALAEALGRLRGDEAVPLLRLLARSKTASVRRTGAAGLGAVATEAALDAALDMLVEDEKVVQDAVLDALVDLDRSSDGLPVRDEVAKILREGAPVSRRVRAAEFFVRLGAADGAEPLEEGLGDRDATVRAACADALGRIGDASPAARETLVSMLDATEPEVCRRAMFALGRLRERAACPALIELLDDEDAALRSSALAALRAISGESLPQERAAWAAWWDRQSAR